MFFLARIVVRITQQWAVYQESVSTGTCLSSRCLTVGRYITINIFTSGLVLPINEHFILQMIFSLQVLQLKFFAHFFPLPYMLPTALISTSLISSSYGT
jgi:hypothetical protein